MIPTLFALLTFADGCPDTWAYRPEPPAVEETEACVRHFVESVYGRDIDPGSIEMDVPAGAGEMLKLSRTQVENGAVAISSVCLRCDTDTCDWRDTYCLRFAAAARLFKREGEARDLKMDLSAGVDIAALPTSACATGTRRTKTILKTVSAPGKRRSIANGSANACQPRLNGSLRRVAPRAHFGPPVRRPLHATLPTWPRNRHPCCKRSGPAGRVP